MATITLAICARNAQHIIGRCLESIQAQTVAPDEILVAVDDESDPTVEVAKQFGARVLASHATGLYEARNAVLNACTTDYLAFTDADCVLTPKWIELAKQVLDEHKEVAAGTGRHPSIGPRTFASWLHHMWFLVETRNTGETDGVIGGNSYFRTDALRAVGGWLKLSGHSAAEDVYISKALSNKGYKIWFEKGVAAQHCYETQFKSLCRKSVMMGKDIVVMMRAAGWYDGLFWYTLAIPVLAAILLLGVLVLPFHPQMGLALAIVPLAGSLLYLMNSFRSISMAFPRWIARWIVIWPYSWGILAGLFAPIPNASKKQ